MASILTRSQCVKWTNIKLEHGRVITIYSFMQMFSLYPCHKLSVGLISAVNSLRRGQNGHHFADDIFKYIFLNGNVLISLKISLKFVRKVPIDNNSLFACQVTSHYLNQWWLIYWRIYASLGLNQLTHHPPSNWQKVSIGSGNGLAPNRRQTITWINVDPVNWLIYAALGGEMS